MQAAFGAPRGFGLTSAEPGRGEGLRTLGEQQFQVLPLQVPNQAFVGGQDGIRQLPLALLQLEHALFDGVLRDQAIGEHVPLLSDPVCAIDGLSFYSGVPPGIEEKDVLSRGEIQPYSARLQADEKQPALRVGLEARYFRFPVARPTIQILIGHAVGIEPRPEQRQQAGEL